MIQFVQHAKDIDSQTLNLDRVRSRMDATHWVLQSRSHDRSNQGNRGVSKPINKGRATPVDTPRYIETTNSYSSHRGSVIDSGKAISSAEAARIIGCTPRALGRMRAKQIGPSYMKGAGKSGVVQYYEADVLACVAHRSGERAYN